MAIQTPRYSMLAIGLHWSIASLILANIWIAWQFDAGDMLQKFQRYQLHKSLGIAVLVLSAVRLGLRLLCPPPAHAPTVTPFEHRAATVVHWGFYLIMIGLPLTGWVAVSASRLNIPTILFGQIPWPHLGFAVGSEPAFRAATTAHEILAWLTYALLALHVGAALKHQFLDRDNILLRMLPRLPARYRRSNIETR